jgi:NADPH-dependent ferric siderophore reductase
VPTAPRLLADVFTVVGGDPGISDDTADLVARLLLDWAEHDLSSGALDAFVAETSELPLKPKRRYAIRHSRHAEEKMRIDVAKLEACCNERLLQAKGK